MDFKEYLKEGMVPEAKTYPFTFDLTLKEWKQIFQGLRVDQSSDINNTVHKFAAKLQLKIENVERESNEL